MKQKSWADDDADMSSEQYWYEWDYHILYRDEVLSIAKEYVDLFTIFTTDDSNGHFGTDSELDYFLDKETGDLGRILRIESLKGMTIVDYMRTKGFPITFLTWV